MKIDEILADEWKLLLSKNLKWIVSAFLRYGFIGLMGFIFFIFIYNYSKTGSITSGPGIIIKAGKTLNVSKPSIDTDVNDIKDIDSTIQYLNELKKKAAGAQK